MSPTDAADRQTAPRRAARAASPLDGAGLQPIRRTNLSATVADRIAEQIASGKLAAGSRLQSERELSDLFGVGRSSIREAIKALESRGLVEGRQGEGRFVRAQDVAGLVRAPSGPVSVSELELLQLYEARKIVEPGMAALAAGRATRRDLAPLRRLIGRHELGLAKGRYGGAEDTAFHMKVAELAGNPLLARLLEAILHMLHAAREPALRSAGALNFSLEGHREIFRALEAQDAVAVQAAALAHLERAQQTALAIVRADRERTTGERP